MLNAVNAELGGRWQAERRLAGGWNEGAYLITRPGGPRAVLKWRASEPERLVGAAGAGGGGPRPWLARSGLASRGPSASGRAWVVQEFIDR